MISAETAPVSVPWYLTPPVLRTETCYERLLVVRITTVHHQVTLATVRNTKRSITDWDSALGDAHAGVFVNMQELQEIELALSSPRQLSLRGETFDACSLSG